jgi:hypothetical protein
MSRRHFDGPSFRELDIFRRVVADKQTQLQVAAALKITQGRVSRAVATVRQWVDCTAGSRPFRTRPDLRFYLALCKERLRLRDEYDPFFKLLDEPSDRRYFVHRAVAVVHGKPKIVAVRTPPTFRDLNRLLDVIERLLELERLGENGPFADFTSELNLHLPGSHAPRGNPLPRGSASPDLSELDPHDISAPPLDQNIPNMPATSGADIRPTEYDTVCRHNRRQNDCHTGITGPAPAPAPTPQFPIPFQLAQTPTPRQTVADEKTSAMTV